MPRYTFIYEQMWSQTTDLSTNWQSKTARKFFCAVLTYIRRASKLAKKQQSTMMPTLFLSRRLFFQDHVKKWYIIRSPSTRAIEWCMWVRLGRTHKEITKIATAVDFAVAIFVISWRKTSARTRQSTSRLIVCWTIDRWRLIVVSVDFHKKIDHHGEVW